MKLIVPCFIITLLIFIKNVKCYNGERKNLSKYLLQPDRHYFNYYKPKPKPKPIYAQYYDYRYTQPNALKSKDSWNPYETPEAPHKYSPEDVEEYYDPVEIYKDYVQGSHNPTPKKLKDCTVRLYYDSHDRLRTMKKLPKFYVDLWKKYEMEYCTEENQSEEKRMTTTASTTPSTTTTTTTTPKPITSKNQHRRMKRIKKLKVNKTTHLTPMFWYDRQITAKFFPQKNYFKQRGVTFTPSWGYVLTTHSQSNTTKKKKYYKAKTSPIKLIVVRHKR